MSKHVSGERRVESSRKRPTVRDDNLQTHTHTHEEKKKNTKRNGTGQQ